MNFCPECGTRLGDAERQTQRCVKGHSLSNCYLVERRETAVGSSTTRKLPTTYEERVEAYHSGIKRLGAIFERLGFRVNCEGGACWAEKGCFGIDFKMVANDGRTAYVTSNRDYNPLKAGKKESGATVLKGRTLFTSRDLLRVTVTGTQSIPIFIEMRQNIPDPELHICKGVMFILEWALQRNSTLHQALKTTDFLKDVPKEWLSAPSAVSEDFPEFEHLLASSQPASLPKMESPLSLGSGPVLDV